MAKKVEHEATGKFMTIDEVAAFVQDAMRSGASGTEAVSATVSFGQKLQAIRTAVDTTARLDKASGA